MWFKPFETFQKRWDFIPLNILFWGFTASVVFTVPALAQTKYSMQVSSSYAIDIESQSTHLDGGFKVTIRANNHATLAQVLEFQSLKGLAVFSDASPFPAEWLNASVPSQTKYGSSSLQPWLFLQSEKGLHFLRATGDSETPWLVVNIPANEKVTAVSTSVASRMGRQPIYAFSVDGATPMTYLFTQTAKDGPVVATSAPEYLRFEEPSSSRQTLEIQRDGRFQLHEIMKEPLHPETAFHPNPFPFEASLPKHWSKDPASMSAKRGEPPEAIRPDLNSPSSAGGSRVESGSQEKKTPVQEDPRQEPAAQPKLTSGAKQLEFKSAEEAYLLYTVDAKSNPATKSDMHGTWLRRQRDGKAVKLAPTSVLFGALQGKEGNSPQIENGVLRHPELPRQISLNHFDIEAVYRPSVESNWVEKFISEYDDYRDMNPEDPIVLDERKPLVEKATTLLFGSRDPKKDKTPQAREWPSTVFLGESTDKDDLIYEVVKKVPPTWKVVELTPESLGSAISYIGEFQTKMKRLLRVAQTIPVIFVARNLEGLKNIGSTEPGGPDFFSMAGNAIKKGQVVILGSGGEQFYESMTNGEVVQSLNRDAVPDLTPESLNQLLRLTSARKYQDLKFENDFFSEIQRLAKKYNPIENEPARSLRLLGASVAYMMVNDITTADRALARTASEESYRLNAELVNLQLLRLKLPKIPKAVDEQIFGNEHIKELALAHVRNGLLSLNGGEEGPRAAVWIDGPPGTGKTQFFKVLAKAMGVPFHKVNMANYTSPDLANDLLIEVANVMRRNPFALTLFDEVEKSHPQVQKVLLDAMSAERFTYYEKVGSTRREAKSSLKNSFVGASSNGLSDFVQSYQRSLGEAGRQMSDGQLWDGFLAAAPVSEWETELRDKSSVSIPFFDRFPIKVVTFLPSEMKLVHILQGQAKSFLQNIFDEHQLELKFARLKSQLVILARRAVKDDLSTRDVISDFKRRAGNAATEKLAVFEPGRSLNMFSPRPAWAIPRSCRGINLRLFKQNGGQP